MNLPNAWVRSVTVDRELVWTCAEEGWWIYQIKDDEDGAAEDKKEKKLQKEKKKIREEGWI